MNRCTAETLAAFGDSVAATANFLEAGSAPLAAPVVRPNFAPGLTVAAPLTVAQRAANARAALAVETKKRAAANAAYLRERQTEEKERARVHAELMRTNAAYAAREKYIATAGLDTAQFLAGAKVIAIGAAVIATGGAVAGAIGLTAGGATLASAAAADRLVALAEKGGEIGKQVKGYVDDAKAVAKKGDATAQQVVDFIDGAVKDRSVKGVANGVVQSLSPAGAAAVEQALAAPSSAATGYAAPLGAAPMTVRPGAVAGANQLSTIRLPSVRPRWLVSDVGKVTDLDLAPSASGHGYVVWSTGKVVRQ